MKTYLFLYLFLFLELDYWYLIGYFWYFPEINACLWETFPLLKLYLLIILSFRIILYHQVWLDFENYQFTLLGIFCFYTLHQSAGMIELLSI